MFSKIKDFFVSTLFYAGITPEEYDSIRSHREEKNKGVLFVNHFASPFRLIFLKCD